MDLRGGNDRQVEPLGDTRAAQRTAVVIWENRALWGARVLHAPAIASITPPELPDRRPSVSDG